MFTIQSFCYANILGRKKKIGSSTMLLCQESFQRNKVVLLTILIMLFGVVSLIDVYGDLCLWGLDIFIPSGSRHTFRNDVVYQPISTTYIVRTLAI